MASRFLKDKRQVHHGRLYLASERMFDLLQDGYRRSLDVALKYRGATLMVFFATVALLNRGKYAYSVPGLLLMLALVPASLAGPL